MVLLPQFDSEYNDIEMEENMSLLQCIESCSLKNISSCTYVISNKSCYYKSRWTLDPDGAHMAKLTSNPNLFGMYRIFDAAVTCSNKDVKRVNGNHCIELLFRRAGCLPEKFAELLKAKGTNWLGKTVEYVKQELKNIMNSDERNFCRHESFHGRKNLAYRALTSGDTITSDINHPSHIVDGVKETNFTGGCSEVTGSPTWLNITLDHHLSLYSVEILSADCCKLPFVKIYGDNKVITNKVIIIGEGNMVVCEVSIFSDNIAEGKGVILNSYRSDTVIDEFDPIYLTDGIPTSCMKLQNPYSFFIDLGDIFTIQQVKIMKSSLTTGAVQANVVGYAHHLAFTQVVNICSSLVDVVFVNNWANFSCQSNNNVRFIHVKTNSNNNLLLCDLIIKGSFSEKGSTNIAFNKICWNSGSYRRTNNLNFIPSKLVDGIIGGTAPYLYQSASPEAWLCVDLYNIFKVQSFILISPIRERGDSFHVTVINEVPDEDWNLTNTNCLRDYRPYEDRSLGSLKIANCTNPYPIGRYFIIVEVLNSSLVASELEIYGILEKEIADLLSLNNISSIHQRSKRGLDFNHPIKMFDENANSIFENEYFQSCATIVKSDRDYLNWMGVDFQTYMLVSKVILVPANDPHQERFNHFQIVMLGQSIANDNYKRSQSGYFLCRYINLDRPLGWIWNIDCKNYTHGQVLIIIDKRINTFRMSICELKIYAVQIAKPEEGQSKSYDKHIFRYPSLVANDKAKYFKTIYSFESPYIFSYTSLTVDTVRLFELNLIRIFTSFNYNSKSSFKIYNSRDLHNTNELEYCNEHRLEDDGEILRESVVKYWCKHKSIGRYVVFEINSALNFRVIELRGSEYAFRKKSPQDESVLQQFQNWLPSISFQRCISSCWRDINCSSYAYKWNNAQCSHSPERFISSNTQQWESSDITFYNQDEKLNNEETRFASPYINMFVFLSGYDAYGNDLYNLKLTFDVCLQICFDEPDCFLITRNREEGILCSHEENAKITGKLCAQYLYLKAGGLYNNFELVYKMIGDLWTDKPLKQIQDNIDKSTIWNPIINRENIALYRKVKVNNTAVDNYIPYHAVDGVNYPIVNLQACAIFTNIDNSAPAYIEVNLESVIKLYCLIISESNNKQLSEIVIYKQYTTEKQIICNETKRKVNLDTTFYCKNNDSAKILNLEYFNKLEICEIKIYPDNLALGKPVLNSANFMTNNQFIEDNLFRLIFIDLEQEYSVNFVALNYTNPHEKNNVTFQIQYIKSFLQLDNEDLKLHSYSKNNSINFIRRKVTQRARYLNIYRLNEDFYEITFIQIYGQLKKPNFLNIAYRKHISLLNSSDYVFKLNDGNFNSYSEISADSMIGIYLGKIYAIQSFALLYGLNNETVQYYLSAFVNNTIESQDIDENMQSCIDNNELNLPLKYQYFHFQCDNIVKGNRFIVLNKNSRIIINEIQIFGLEFNDGNIIPIEEIKQFHTSDSGPIDDYHFHHPIKAFDGYHENIISDLTIELFNEILLEQIVITYGKYANEEVLSEFDVSVVRENVSLTNWPFQVLRPSKRNLLAFVAKAA
ncbi:DgyrCDS4151 [Dimorphilus gyrociliatus]|uniref:DgyrCDS4151 n=1 Tax=Dimorphilus gyrociliatus TaxID=2664684 RepID=A0A7I8VFS8_9ANNE|nr:DgyrCDS4151 [Dimorphilus gyrociliatus]